MTPIVLVDKAIERNRKKTNDETRILSKYNELGQIQCCNVINKNYNKKQATRSNVCCNKMKKKTVYTWQTTLNHFFPGFKFEVEWLANRVTPSLPSSRSLSGSRPTRHLVVKLWGPQDDARVIPRQPPIVWLR